MSTRSFCVVITHEEGFFVGSNQRELLPLVEGQKLKQILWHNNPHGLEDFLKKNPDQKGVVYKAIHYWALCALGRVKLDENAYGMLKRKLSNFGNKLYSKVRRVAKKVAVLFQKAFLTGEQEAKLQEKTLKYLKKRGITHVRVE